MWCRRDLVARRPAIRCAGRATPGPVSSTVTSTKWLPDPSDPSCSAQLLRVPRRVEAGLRGQPGQAARPAVRRSRRPFSVVAAPPTTGPVARWTACSSLQAVDPQLGEREPRSAPPCIPQPMSTPTAAGMMAPSRRDHAADRRALAEVRVRHEGQVRLHERHRRGRLGLPARAVLQQRRPAVQLRPQLLHSSSSLPAYRRSVGVALDLRQTRSGGPASLSLRSAPCASDSSCPRAGGSTSSASTPRSSGR